MAFGEKHKFSASYGKVSGAVQRECRFLRVRAKECDSDADKCEFSLLHYLRMGFFFLRSPERISPHFLKRSP